MSLLYHNFVNISTVSEAIIAKAPSGRELAPQATEGERVAVKFHQISKSRRLLPPLRGPPFLPEEGFR